MHETYHIHTLTLQYTDDVVVMYTFHQKSLGLWGWVRVQTRAGIHIGTTQATEFYMELRSSIENALEQVFVDYQEESAFNRDEREHTGRSPLILFVPEDEISPRELLD